MKWQAVQKSPIHLFVSSISWPVHRLLTSEYLHVRSFINISYLFMKYYKNLYFKYYFYWWSYQGNKLEYLFSFYYDWYAKHISIYFKSIFNWIISLLIRSKVLYSLQLKIFISIWLLKRLKSRIFFVIIYFAIDLILDMILSWQFVSDVIPFNCLLVHRKVLLLL